MLVIFTVITEENSPDFGEVTRIGLGIHPNILKIEKNTGPIYESREKD